VFGHQNWLSRGASSAQTGMDCAIIENKIACPTISFITGLAIEWNPFFTCIYNEVEFVAERS
jgi:hypothetical protein